MITIKQNIIQGLAIAICLGLGLSNAALAGKASEKAFNVAGVISSVDTVRQTATVGAVTYKLLPDTVAYDSNGKRISLRRLIKGTRVGLELYRSDDKVWYVREFWIINKSQQKGIPGEG